MQICPGKKYRIVGYTPECANNYRHKLLAMGFTPGTVFSALRVAPLGDPIEIEIKGFLLSIRRAESQVLRIEHLHE